MDMLSNEKQNKNISILRNALSFAAATMIFFNAQAKESKTIDADQDLDTSSEKNLTENTQEEDIVLEQETDPVLEALKAKKASLMDELTLYTQEEKAIIAQHEQIIDQAADAADPYWEMEALLQIAKDNRRRGGNLRVNTRRGGKMFTARNLLINNRVGQLGDDQRMLKALVMGADPRYVKNKKVREGSLRVANELADQMEVWDKLRDIKLGRADKVAKVAIESRDEKRRRGYRTGRSNAVSFARGQYNSQRKLDRNNASLFFAAHTPVISRVLDYSIDKAIVQENIIEREEIAIDNVRYQYGNIKREIKAELSDVNRDIREHIKEVRLQKKMGAVDDHERTDQFNLSKMDIDDQTELAQNDAGDDYKENQDIVTGFDGVEEGKTFHLKHIHTKPNPTV